MTSARVLVPTTITSAMILGGTSIAEPAAGEIAWVSAAAYALGDERIRTTTHKVYECVQAHTGRAIFPENDGAYWLKKRPTLRWSPFDDYSNTKAEDVTTVTYVLQPGFMNGLSLYGLEGSAYSITVKDMPGGSVIISKTGDLYEQALGFYELLYAPLLQLTQISLDSIPIAPEAEVTITITAGIGAAVAIGTIKAGDWRPFIGTGSFGGAVYGAQSVRNSYTFRKYEDDGTYSTIKRPSTRDIRASVVIDPDQANYADAILAEIIDTAVPFEATGLGRYAYLNTMGFVSGTVTADSAGTTTLNLTIKGTI